MIYECYSGALMAVAFKYVVQLADLLVCWAVTTRTCSCRAQSWKNAGDDDVCGRKFIESGVYQ